MENNLKFYRYVVIQYASKDIDGEYYNSRIPNPTIRLEEYDMLKETPKGYWIGYSGFRTWKKWVSKTSKKRFAYPTKEEALNNFIRRTEVRIKILSSQIMSSKIALSLAKNVKLS